MKVEPGGNRGPWPTLAMPWRPARSVAVVLAGGTGTRLGLGIPKQLLKVAGKSVIEHTITVFETAPEIDEIIVLMAPGHVGPVRQIVENAGFRKVTRVTEGGATRSETTRKALELIGPENCNILFHDAVRPLLTPRIVRECVDALATHSAVDVAIPSADTVVVVDENDYITDIPVRSRLRRGQTPQAFRSTTIREAYRLACADPNFTATDDCGVVLRYLPDVPIRVVAGGEENIKITYPVDIHLADRLLRLAAEVRPRQLSDGSRVEALRDATMVVFGDSHGFGHELTELSRSYGARVYAFSRLTTGTHLDRPVDVEAALRGVFAATGRIDYVVVATETVPDGRLVEFDEHTVEQTVRMNYLAPIIVARQALPYLRQTRGHLLLHTSDPVSGNAVGSALHSSSTAAIVNLMQALANEWSEESVRVNCITVGQSGASTGDPIPGGQRRPVLLADTVARVSVDVLVSRSTGQVVDLGRARSGPIGAQVERVVDVITGQLPSIGAPSQALAPPAIS